MRSNFESLKSAKPLMDDAKKLETFHTDFEEATKKGNKGRIDKYKKGFNADDRFKSFSTNVYFSAYTGVYGSSSVGSFMLLNSGKVGDALIQYLAENEEEVIKGMGVILDKKAKSLVEKARKEVETAATLIDVIENYSAQ